MSECWLPTGVYTLTVSISNFTKGTSGPEGKTATAGQSGEFLFVTRRRQEDPADTSPVSLTHATLSILLHRAGPEGTVPP